MTINDEEKGPTQPASGACVVHSESTANIAASTAKLAELKQIEADSYDPFSNRVNKNQYSDMGALAHLLKGSLGSGVLAMPMAFKNGGLVFGAVGTAVIGLICTHTVLILIRSSQDLCRRLKVPSLGFAETAQAAFESGPECLRPLANFARRFVIFSLFTTYYFGLCVYVVFIAESCKQLVEDYKNDVGKPVIDWSQTIYILILLIPLLPLGLIRNLKHLIPISTIANGCILVGFGILMYYLLREPKDFNDRYLYPPSLSTIPTFFVTVLFAMEGIGTVMPIENTMRYPQNLGGSFGVMSKAMIFVVIIFGVLGFLGYLEYGEDTKGSITLSLPTHELPAKIVKALFAITILFTYPLQFHVPCMIMWSAISTKLNKEKHNIAQHLMRIAMVLGIVIVALIVPKLDIIISLVGALFFSVLGLFIPAVVEIVTCWDRGLGCLKWKLWKDIFLIILSIFAMVSGTYISIIDALAPEHEATPPTPVPIS